MKKILKWGGIASGIFIVSIILLAIFVPSPNGSFESDSEMEGGKEEEILVENLELSDEEKKSIFKEVVAAEDRGRNEAEEQCPTDATSDPLFNKWQEMTDDEREEYLQGCIELQSQLSEKYRNEVLDEYELNKEEWSEISRQAQEEQWPLD